MARKYRIWRAGYWISPRGKFFEVTTHIDSVCRFPKQFGIDESVLRRAFAEFGENYGEERMVRELVIQALVKAARWIRLRNRGNRGWDISVGAVDERTMRRLMGFFKSIYGGENCFDTVIIRSPNETLEVDVAFVSNGEWFKKQGFSPEVVPNMEFISGPEQISHEEIIPVDLDVRREK